VSTTGQEPEHAAAPALRSYQLEAVEKAAASIAAGKNPLVVLPTGAGKSVVLAELARRHTHLRPLILTHRQELVAQDAAAIERLTGQTPAVICAGLGRNDSPDAAPIVVGSVQTVARRDVPGRRLLIVDEAHLVSPDEGSQYQQVIGRHPEAAIVGLSATPYRLDDGPLVTHPDIPFDEVAIDVPARDLVAQGYLCRVVLDDRRNHAIPTGTVKKRGGEFILGELEKLAAVAELVERQIEDAATQADSRRSILVFTVGKGHAALVTAAIARRGERVALVSEDTPPAQRADVIAAFRSGELRWLVNIDVLTVGFDAPNIDAIVCLRPTCSRGLFVQMVGRGYRIAAGKTDCLVLDYGGNVARHDPLDEVPGERRVNGVKKERQERREATQPSSAWLDRALLHGFEPVGRCQVLDWYAQPQPSRSAPGTWHVRLALRLRTPAGLTKRACVWWTPEHPNKFARYRALRLGRRLGLPEQTVNARTLAWALNRARPVEVDAFLEQGFWRITW